MALPPAKSFRELTVWQKAHAFVLATYELTASFPSHEKFGMAAQLRRAAVSVPANIAEGFKRRGRGDKVRFLNVAQSSLEEARYYLLLANDLQYGKTAAAEKQAEEVARILEVYARSIENSGD